MSRAKKNMITKRIVDAAMTVLLLLLMAYQVTGEMAHEWIGMGMTVLVIIHQILNRKWYGALFKGKYNPYVVDFDTDELVRKSIASLDSKLRVSKIYFKVETRKHLP